MKQAIFVLLALVGAVATYGASQGNPGTERKHLMIALPEGPNIGLTAAQIQRQEPALHVLQLKGNVEIRTKDMILRADEADYNENTGEIEARGAVHIKLETQR